MTKLYWLAGEPLENFFARIDSLGGWPLGMSHVWGHHCCSHERPVEFGTHDRRDEWWTTICTADDYYWAKISEYYKTRLRNRWIGEFKDRIVRMTTT
jgi:hypothetical protein